MAVKSKTTSKSTTSSPAPKNSKVESGKNAVKKVNVTYILFFLLIVAAFLIGVLFTQVQFLKNGSAMVGTTDVTADTTGSNVQAGPVDVDTGKLPILGDKNAKVTLVEFSDFQCPFCKQMFEESFPQIKKDFIDTGKAKFAYRHYPLTTLHPNAQKAAEASECANAQGKFWDYHDQLFTNQADWEALDSAGALDKFVEYANTVGIDGEALRECVSSGKMAENVKKDVEAGSKVGVDGTPATFVNGILVSGAVPYEEIKAQIETAIEEAK